MDWQKKVSLWWAKNFRPLVVALLVIGFGVKAYCASANTALQRTVMEIDGRRVSLGLPAEWLSPGRRGGRCRRWRTASHAG